MRLMIPALTLCLLLVPVTAQEGELGIVNPKESTPTTLYFHLDGIRHFPINTQPPEDKYQDDNAYGSTTSSFSCAPVDVPGTNLDSKEWHTYYGYSSPGYVEYDFEQDGRPRYHTERGLNYDLQLDASSQPVLYWYLTTVYTTSDTSFFPSDPNDLPGVVPNVVVKASMRLGDDVDVGVAAFNAGKLVAQGQTEPMTLQPGAANEVMPGVFEMVVPLAYDTLTTIPAEESYNLRVDVFMDNPVCTEQPEEGYMMQNLVESHTSANHRPRMDLASMNPITIDLIHPMFVGDDVVVHTNMNSPWGNYDVDENNIKFDIEGPSQAHSLALWQFDHESFFHDHFNHDKPLEVVYLWPYLQDDAENGIYHAVLEVQNDQNTAKATGRIAFQIGKPTSELPPCDPDAPEAEQTNCAFFNEADAGGKESPGAPLVALIAMLGLLVLRRK